MNQLKVALVHEMLSKMGGAERVLDLLQKMFPESPIYTLAYDEEKCGKVFPKEKIKTSRLQKYLNWGVPRQLLVHKMPRAIEDFDFSDFDLVISSSSAFAHGIITPSGVPHICYVHAPMRYVWDYTHEYFREKTQGWKRILKSPLLSLMHDLRIWDFTAGKRPDLLLANSKTTQERINKFWRESSQVVYPPVDTKKFSGIIPVKKECFSPEYYLIVSALEAFKKIDIAVEAFSKFSGKFATQKLIIIGDGSDKTRLKSLAQQGKYPENIIFLGRKSDEEVVGYMQNCKALLFPGIEDFGITPVEAMAAHKPVIFYTKGGVAESVISLDSEISIDSLSQQKSATGIGFTEQTPDSLQKAILYFESPEVSQFFQLEEQKKVLELRSEKFSEKTFKKNIEYSIQQFYPDFHCSA